MDGFIAISCVSNPFSSLSMLSPLLSCSFYLLDLKTISSVDILETTCKKTA